MQNKEVRLCNSELDGWAMARCRQHLLLGVISSKIAHVTEVKVGYLIVTKGVLFCPLEECSTEVRHYWPDLHLSISFLLPNFTQFVRNIWWWFHCFDIRSLASHFAVYSRNSYIPIITITALHGDTSSHTQSGSKPSSIAKSMRVQRQRWMRKKRMIFPRLLMIFTRAWSLSIGLYQRRKYGRDRLCRCLSQRCLFSRPRELFEFS